MRIPSISPASNYPSFEQRKPTAPAAYENTQAAPAVPTQQPTALNGGQASSNTAQLDLATLLSSQGATIIPPQMRTPPQLITAPHAISFTATQPAGGNALSGPPTALEQANQIMGALGSNGVLTLAEVEKAENGRTAAPAGDALDSNTDSDIAADFTQLSGGSSAMTVAQLTSAIQQDANPQNQHPHSYGKVILPGASTAVSTTDGVPNSAGASASSRARTAASEYLWQEERITEAANPRR
jgi:hypothetical protein